MGRLRETDPVAFEAVATIPLKKLNHQPYKIHLVFASEVVRMVYPKPVSSVQNLRSTMAHHTNLTCVGRLFGPRSQINAWAWGATAQGSDYDSSMRRARLASDGQRILQIVASSTRVGLRCFAVYKLVHHES